LLTLAGGINIYTTFYNLESMSCKTILLPLLLDAGIQQERELKA